MLRDEVYGLATILGLTVAEEIFRQFLLFLQSSGTNPNFTTGTFDAVFKIGLLGYGIQFAIQNLAFSTVSFLITISTFALFALLIGMVVLLLVDAIFCLIETQT